MLLQPILMVIGLEYAQAATTSDPSTTTLADQSDPNCLAIATNFFTTGALPSYLTSSGTVNYDGGGDGPFAQEFDLNAIKNDKYLTPDIINRITSDQYINQIMLDFGPQGLAHYKSPDGKINVLVSCVQSDPTNNNLIDPALFDPIMPISVEGIQLFNLLDDPNPKITFKNELDYYALVGENCAGGLTNDPNDPCPASHFNATTDDVFPNGVWDGPKADIRVLRALVYLVTPVSQGGAGRDHIDVSRIIQYGKTDLLIPPPTSDSSTNTANSSSTSGTNSSTSGATVGSNGSTTSSLGYLVPQGLAPQVNSSSSNSAVSTLNSILSATNSNLSLSTALAATTNTTSGSLSSGSSSTSSSSTVTFPPNLGTDSLSITTPNTTAVATPTPTPPAANEAQTSSPSTSKCYIDPNDDPVHPAHISTCLDIDEIDQIRTTTKEIDRHPFYDTVKYHYQAPFPIKVAWETTAGLQSNPPPSMSNLNMLQMSRISMNGMIIDLLNQYGIGNLNLDVSNVSINSFGDVAQLVGESILEQLMNTPNGSMKGWSLSSVVDSIGRAYLASQLGLVPGALSSGDNFQQIVRNIGEKTLEYSMQFPSGSLETSSGSSADLIENIGRRYLESQVFLVSQGTLTPSTGYPINTLGDLLARLGEGYIENTFQLPPQSLRLNCYDNGGDNALTCLRNSSFKASLLFPSPTASPDYATSDYFSSKLNLGFIPASSGSSLSRYGFTQDQFNDPLVQLQTGKMNLTTFMQLVGSKAIENSVAQFSPAGLEQTTTTGTQTSTTAGRIPTEWVGIQYVEGGGKPYILNALKQGDGETNPPPSYNILSTLNTPPNQTTNQGVNSSNLPGCENGTGVQYGGNMGLYPGGANSGVVPTISSILKPAQALDFDTQCLEYQVAAPTKDLTPLKSVGGFLSTTPNYSYVFNNSNNQTPPQPSDFTDNGALTKFNDGKDPNRNYNDAYRNFIWSNTVKTPTNTIASYDPTQPPVPIMTVLSQDISFIKNDSSFQNRLQVLENLYNRDNNTVTYNFPNSIINANGNASVPEASPPKSTTNFFDLTPLVDETGTTLDTDIINRLNRIVAYPTSLAQYNTTNYDPKYFSVDNPSASGTPGDTNGWLFTLNDLSQNLQCTINGGTYSEVGQNNSFSPSCNNAYANTNNISASDKYYAQQVITEINNLVTQFNTLANTYVTILDRGGKIQPIINNTSSQTQNSTAGQSGMSASIGVPGEIYATNSNGMMDPAKPLYNSDPMRMLLAPDIGGNGVINTNVSYIPTTGSSSNSAFDFNLQKIGLVYAAQHFSTDAITQRKFVSVVANDFQNTSDFNQAMDDFQQIGISTDTLTSSGLGISDFERMFFLNLANNVFDRVGKEELMRVLWQKTNATTQIQNSTQYQNVIQDLNKATQKIAFYTIRISDVQNKTIQLKGVLQSLSPLIKNFQATFSNIKDPPKLNNIQSNAQNWQSLQNVGQTYEVQVGQYNSLINQAQANNSGGSYSAKIQSAKYLADSIKQDLEEIAAGEQLPQASDSPGIGGFANFENNSGYGANNLGSSSTYSCISTGNIVSALTHSAFSMPTSLNTATSTITNTISNLGLYIGGCTVDQALGLPTGSTYAWYNLGANNYPKQVTLPSNTNYNDGIGASVSNSLSAQNWVSEVSLGNLNQTVNNTPSNNSFNLTSPTLGISVSNLNTQISLNTPFDGSAGPPTASLPAAEFSGSSSSTTSTAPNNSGAPQWKAGNWTVGNFKLAIGLANAVNRNQIPNTNMGVVYNLSSQKIIQYTEDGAKILTDVALVKLNSLIPGLSQLNRQYGINDQDLVSLLQGNTEPVIAKIGGVTLDKALGLPVGTGAALIYPPCFTQQVNSSGQPTGLYVSAPCNGATASQNPDNVRLIILSELGFQKLGLQIPAIPAGFSLLAKGNMATNWGNAQITQDLGLASNSFEGNFQDPNSVLRTNNSYNSLMNAFGLSSTPFDQALTSAYQSMSNILLNLVSNQNVNSVFNYYIGNDLQQISAIMQQYLVKSLFDQLKNPNSDYWKNYGNSHADFSGQGADLAGLDEQQYSATIGELIKLINTSLQGIDGTQLGNSIKSQLDTALFFDKNNNNYFTNYPGLFNNSFAQSLADGSQQIAPDNNGALSAASSLFDPQKTLSSLSSPYANMIRNFQNRVNMLDGAYNLTGTSIDPINRTVIKYGAFEQLLQGSMTADQLSTATGVNAATGIVANSIATKIDSTIKNGPQWLQDINTGLETLTAGNVTGCSLGSSSNPNNGLSIGMVVGNMIANSAINGGKSPCTNSNLNAININDILTSNSPNDVNFRLFLFNKFLSRTFSAQLEHNVGLEYGTFQTMAAYPEQAPQILLDQGVIKASNQIFGSVDINDPCQYGSTQTQCITNTIKADLKQAFLAGFQETQTTYDMMGNPTYVTQVDSMGNPVSSTQFSTQRALQSLNNSVNKEIDNQLNRLGDKYFGVGLTRGEIQLFLQGNGQFFTYLGLQYSVNALNKAFNSDPNVANNPRKQEFEISYLDVLNSVMPSLSPGELQYIKNQAATSYDYNTICSSGSTYIGSVDCENYISSNLNNLSPNSASYSSFQTLQGLSQTAQKNSSLEPSTISSITNGASLDQVASDTILAQAYADPLGYLQSTNSVSILGTSNPTEQQARDFLFENNSTTLTPDGSDFLQAQVGSDLSLATNTKIKEALTQKQIAAQSALKYAALDQIAFRFDQNIPANFSARLFGASAPDRADVLVDYGLNMLANKSPIIKEMCNVTSNNADGDCSGLTNTLSNLYNLFFGNSTDKINAENNLGSGNGQSALANLDGVFTHWIDHMFGIPQYYLPSGLLMGIVSWGSQGFSSSSFNKTDISFGGKNVPALGAVLETAGINYMSTLADKALDLPPGTTNQIVQLVQISIDIYNLQNLSSDAKNLMGIATYDSKLLKLRTAAVTLAISIVVDDLLGQTLTKVDQDIGLPPGTMAQIMTLGAQVAISTFFPNFMTAMGPAAFDFALAMIAINLVFGVSKVIKITRSTADGYYPFYDRGTSGVNSAPQYLEAPDNGNPLLGEFDPTKTASYNAGLMAAARGKVVGVIRDLLSMAEPGKYWVVKDNLTAQQLVPVQIFTYGDTSYTPFSDPLLARMPSISDILGVTDSSNSGNPWSTQCVNGPYYDSSLNQYMCDRPVGFRVGVFPDPNVTNSLMISW